MGGHWHTSTTCFDLLNYSPANIPAPLAGCISQRFGTHISSPLVRSAVLYLSSFSTQGTLSPLGSQYLCDFCKYAREAIDTDGYIELLYGSYLMCLSEMGCKRGNFENHAQGFLCSYQYLERLGKVFTTEEKEVFGRAYETILDTIHAPKLLGQYHYGTDLTMS